MVVTGLLPYSIIDLQNYNEEKIRLFVLTHLSLQMIKLGVDAYEDVVLKKSESDSKSRNKLPQFSYPPKLLGKISAKKILNFQEFHKFAEISSCRG